MDLITFFLGGMVIGMAVAISIYEYLPDPRNGSAKRRP